MRPLFLILPLIGFLLSGHAFAGLSPVPLQSKVTGPQPMTGLVFWDTSPHRASDAIQLEFSYVGYAQCAAPDGGHDWSLIEEKLDAIAARKHQAILRFYLVYPGRAAQTPEFITSQPGYQAVTAPSEGKETGFADWSHPVLQQWILDFHQAFAKRYDQDPRLAFVQAGFGLWAEYHIYDGPFQLGQTFPDRDYQARFFRHLHHCYQHTPWSVSVDSAKRSVSPFYENPELLQLPFGVFDDSFLCEAHGRVNTKDWKIVGMDRHLTAPCGGEFSYYTPHDQETALAESGPHGESFEAAAARFGITYMIADGQPQYQSMERIQAAGRACGYQFRITEFLTSAHRSKITVTNEGIAPIYRDAYLALNGVRATQSLKLLAPGASLTVEIPSGGEAPSLAIECDHLVPGQVVEFNASLSGE